ncbi:hypothetical protein NPIL_7851 [Nephila pilipes]|uniref:Uncharacterized protein n=1 Tax=Nephila pilipes TaxID=299642 RepID=A0A8X6QLS5_NEPPI|nr:hypothetical protein NPIL_7851 [Nephila pilipes]
MEGLILFVIGVSTCSASQEVYPSPIFLSAFMIRVKNLINGRKEICADGYSSRNSSDRNSASLNLETEFVDPLGMQPNEFMISPP